MCREPVNHNIFYIRFNKSREIAELCVTLCIYVYIYMYIYKYI